MKAWRITLMSAGILLGLFGAFRLLTQVSIGDLVILAAWMIGAVVIHDGILSPVVVGVGWFIGRRVPPRARRYLQAALIAGGLIIVVAIPLILRRDSKPAVKALLLQNYAGNLTVLLAIVAIASLLLYAARVAVDRSRGTASTSDGPADLRDDATT